MKDNRRIKKSHRLARLLRHDDSCRFQDGGWLEVPDVLGALHVSPEELEEIVSKDQKGRYEISEDGSRIRARDGYDEFIPHSPKKPAVNYPRTLYHGTSLDSVASILELGIRRMRRGRWRRAYVNLSADRTTALRVGLRKGDPVVLCIDTPVMTGEGYNLYEPESEPWTADEVPKEAIGGRMLIGRTVAYYEDDAQGKAVYDICCGIQARERSAPDGIIYDNDTKSRSITAFVPVDVNAGRVEYDLLMRDLSLFIAGPLQAGIATALVDLMPKACIRDRRRASFYLEMSQVYRSHEREFRMPVDRTAVRRLLEKCRTFEFGPPVVEGTMSSLLAFLEDDLERYKGREGTHFVIWLDIPPLAADNHCELMDFMWDLHCEGIMPLVGVCAIPGQETCQATVCRMEEQD